MSETAPMEQFNINELAGATGLILGAVGGILAIIFKSRCHCKFRIGISDKFSLCMCERKPPPDINESDEEDTGGKILKKEEEILKEEEVIQKDIESLVPKKEEKQNIKFDINEKDNIM